MKLLLESLTIAAAKNPPFLTAGSHIRQIQNLPTPMVMMMMAKAKADSEIDEWTRVDYRRNINGRSHVDRSRLDVHRSGLHINRCRTDINGRRLHVHTHGRGLDVNGRRRHSDKHTSRRVLNSRSRCRKERED